MSAVVTHTAQEVPVSTSISAGSNDSTYLPPYCNYREDPNYKYNHLLPVYLQTSCPPFVLFLHINPNWRALSHENPQNEIKDQLALFIAQRGVVAYMNQLRLLMRLWGLQGMRTFRRQVGALFSQCLPVCLN